MTEIKSGNIKSIDYNPDAKTLSVRFAQGQTYHYDQVPQHVYDQMMAAPSTGSYFYKHVRNSFKFRKG